MWATDGVTVPQEGSIEVRVGHLLVATPSLSDPNFFRTVVLVLDHDDAGTLGVVLNRPTDVPVHEVLPQWSAVVSGASVLFSGGPVVPGGLALGRRGREVPPGWTPVTDDLGTLDLDADPDEVVASLESLRLFTGYTGWSPGQLAEEVADGAWFVVDHHPDDPFEPNPEGLWQQVLRRQRGRLRLYATYPVDLARN